MNVGYFGHGWNPDLVGDAMEVPTPVDATCGICRDQVIAGDRGWTRAPHGTAYHIECEALLIAGHSVGVCPCYGYTPSRAAGLLAAYRLTNGHDPDRPTILTRTGGTPA